MQTFTKQKLFSWIKQQPDDKPVKMWEGNIKDECGCVLVQFGKFNKLQRGFAGYSVIGDMRVIEDDYDCVFSFISNCLRAKPKDFHRVKQILRQYDTTKN